MKTELTVTLLDENFDITLGELCRACQTSADRIQLLVEEGIIEPRGSEPAKWRFTNISIRRIRKVQRLQSDLGVNLAGAALALELSDEIERLRRRLQRFEEL